MAKKKTKLQITLDDLNACTESVRWVNGKTPATAWKQCKRPDWLLWVVGHLAKTDDYYKRALASAIAACIDVLCENDEIINQHWAHIKENDEVERAYAIKISTLLDQKGQGKTVRLRRRSESSMPAISWPLDTLLTIGEDILRNNVFWNNIPDDLCMIRMGGVTSKKLDPKMCNEIRRVVERPTVQELQVAAKDWLDEL